MSYAIIRNTNCKRDNLAGIYRHNERKNTSYTNKNINHQKSYQNYSIKSCDINYLKKFDQIRQDYDLKGWVKKNSNIKLDNIDGKKIAVQLGSVADTYVSENYKKSMVIQQKKYLSMIEDLKADKVDLVIMDNLPAQKIVDENPNLKILDGYLFSDSYGIAVKKGNKELLDGINTVLERLMSEGKIDEYVINHS